jgi:hypothetical protein
VNANVTGVADGFATGVADSRPPSTRKTSIELVLAFVVTSSQRPSGVNPTWPDAVRKFGGSPFARPSERAEPAMGSRPSSPIQKPWTVPDFRTVSRRAPFSLHPGRKRIKELVTPRR